MSATVEGRAAPHLP
ncbi:hypothetical protein LINGRAHAP2_LOCUS26162 [Linum grandiflorum]